MSASQSSLPNQGPQSALDRRSVERNVPHLRTTLREDRATRVLVISGDAAPLLAPDALGWLSPREVPSGVQEWVFLGRFADGTAALAAILTREDDPAQAYPDIPAPSGWGHLRKIGGGLEVTDADAMVAAVSAGQWLLGAAFCPACGGETRVESAGWSRRCVRCHREHFPRTDPAVIVAITSKSDPDRLLLGANAAWGGERYSCFAGFTEAGESLEATVVREVKEEAGVDVDTVRYHSSQPWPYPRSLMLGFYASAIDDEQIQPDGEEIVSVRWFSREEIAEGLAGRADFGLPGTSSIAHRLISLWCHGRQDE